MRYTSKQIGEIVRRTRKSQGATQRQLAMVAGTGLRFISDLEQGKPSCELEKVLRVLNTLGIDMRLKASGDDDEY